MIVTAAKFAQPDIDGTVVQLADHMPSGAAWAAKLVEDSTLHSQMHGTAKPFNMAQGRIEDLTREFDINQTVELITDWETSVGLPDVCLGPVSGIDDRRALVVERLSKTPVTTLAQQQAFIDRLFPGLGVTLIPGAEFFSFEYTLEMFFLGDVDERFIIVALIPPQEPFFEFDFEFDFTGGVGQPELQCVLDRISPANVLPIILEGVLS